MNDHWEYLKIPKQVIKNKHLRATAKLLYGYLIFRQGGNSYSYWTINHMAEDTGTPYGTIRKDIRQLGACGYIEIKRTIRHKKRHNQYRVIGPR